MQKKIVFFNIAYMKNYRGDDPNDLPVNGGKYVDINSDALEKFNFEQSYDGFVRGYVETKYKDSFVNAEKPKQLNITQIDSDFRNEDKIDNVTVIFCAKSPIVNYTVIVGYYKKATVYRNRKYLNDLPYNCITKSEFAYLIPENERIFEVPRAKANEHNLGFGQANVWYAKKEGHREFVESVIKYIEDNKLPSVEKEDDIFLESGIGKEVVLTKYERNPKARAEAIKIHGSKCVVCGFDSKQVYGSDYVGRIHIHHLNAIHTMINDYKIDPSTDLVPVCPNCHMILHTKINGKEVTLNDLKKLITKLK